MSNRGKETIHGGARTRLLRTFAVAALCGVVFAEVCMAQPNSWRKATPPAGLENTAPFDLDMASATEGWLVGVEMGTEEIAPPIGGLALQLSGGTWTKATPPEVSVNWALHGVSCTPDGVWFAGSNAIVDLEIGEFVTEYAAKNGGKQVVTTPAVTLFRPNGGAMAVVANEMASAVLAVLGFGAGDAWFAAYSTMDSLAGGGWFSTPVGDLTAIQDISFPASDNGWAVGRGIDTGAVAHFDGSAWTAETLPVLDDSWELHGVSFPSVTEGWAVGQVLVTTAKQTTHYEGVILHYDSGVWSSVTPPTVSGDWYLEDVCFPTVSEGWAVGTDLSTGGGVILHYSAGTWQNETQPVSGSDDWSLSCVSFWDATHGWAAGYDNTNGAFLLLKYLPGLPEDINVDTQVNAVDVQLVINAALGIDIGSEYEPDVDADGTTNAVDVQRVINGALGIFS